MTGNTNTLIFGLDGGTWRILEPLINEGSMPALRRLKKDGVYGEMKSTIPPVTGGAWPSIARGKSPGKTGLIDFVNKKEDSRNLKSVSSKDFRKDSVWDILSNSGEKVAVVNYPMLSPPYEINGFMISGIGSSSDEEITYPPELKGRLQSRFGSWNTTVNYHEEKYNDKNLFLDHLDRFLKKQMDIFRFFLNKKDLDFFFYVLSATDWFQHRMWKYWEKESPCKEFTGFFGKVDRFFEEINPEKWNIFVISDHGFGPQDQCFNLLKWMKKKRYQKMKNTAKSNLLNSLKGKMFEVLKGFSDKGFGKYVSDRIKGGISKSLKTSIVDKIDFDKSKAYCLGHTIPFGGIYIKKSLEKEEKNQVKEEIFQELSNLSKDLNRDLNVDIYYPDKLYDGKEVDNLPDIIFTINNWRCIVNETNLEEPLFKDEPYSPRHTGSHRVEGIFLAHGSEIRDSGDEIKDVSIYDIMPTIFHMHDIGLPPNLDGRVLKEIFSKNSSPAKRRVRQKKLSGREEKKIKKLKESESI